MPNRKTSILKASGEQKCRSDSKLKKFNRHTPSSSQLGHHHPNSRQSKLPFPPSDAAMKARAVVGNKVGMMVRSASTKYANNITGLSLTSKIASNKGDVV